MMKENYLEAIALIEKNYRLYLDVLKSEIQTLGTLDVNHTQAMILCHIGDRKLSISEIVDKGHFVGSNVSYNVKKLITSKYLQSEISEFDKRAVYITLTNKGKVMKDKLNASIESHKNIFNKYGLAQKEFEQLTETLHKLEYCLSKILKK